MSKRVERPGVREGYDRWAETYDVDVATSTEFPLAGYEQVLAEVLSQADVRPGMSVLDLGTGTGKQLWPLRRAGDQVAEGSEDETLNK